MVSVMLRRPKLFSDFGLRRIAAGLGSVRDSRHPLVQIRERHARYHPGFHGEGERQESRVEEQLPGYRREVFQRNRGDLHHVSETRGDV